ncbi:hypothetical protein KKE74_03570 [Patescibacteria group bacterium]|nr:hypothetical protein [Patescibacteria group bacterium]MBU2473084.1 hypothetical protein [Patescibacteria group bacterium]
MEKRLLVVLFVFLMLTGFTWEGELDPNELMTEWIVDESSVVYLINPDSKKPNILYFTVISPDVKSSIRKVRSKIFQSPIL